METEITCNASTATTSGTPLALFKFTFEELANKRMDSGIYLLGLIALFGWTIVILWMTRPFWTGRIKLHGNDAKNLLMNETIKTLY